jgi:methylamine dehydrogenase heavy chain
MPNETLLKPCKQSCLRLFHLALFCLIPVHAAAELPAEPVSPDQSVKLATPYPASYVIAHDFSFGAIIDSAFALVDIETGAFKGMLSAGQFATLSYSSKRQKFYVGETVHSRGNRGTREDLVAVYDFAHLQLQKDIVLQPKRSNSVNLKNSTAVTADDRFLLVFNMSPATSVTVIDLDTESIVSDFDTPGCSLVYPDLHGDFFMLCGNGSLLAVDLDDKGQVVGTTVSPVFNVIDKDPLSEKASLVGDSWYFVTFAGEVQPIKVSGNKPEIMPRWWSTSAAERTANWRPAGWHGTAGSGHADGLLWVAMTPKGYPGSHKDPATEVWLFDTTKQARLARLPLKTPAISIGVTGSAEPRLVVANVESALDVYDGRTGKHVNTIRDLGESPYQVYSVGIDTGKAN